MKNFNYTVRDRSGSMKRGNLKAIDRNAALHELVAQGMVPLSVTEGAVQPVGGRGKPIYAIIAGIAAMIIVGVAVVVLFQASSTPKKSGKKRLPAKTTSSVPGQRNTKQAPAKVPSVAPTNIAQVAAVTSLVTTASVTNAVGEIRSALPEPVTNKVPRLFSTTTEQVISWIANTIPGSTPPPLPRLPVNESTNIVAILNSDIPLYDDDSEKIVEIKFNVAHAKQLLKEYLAQGGKAEEFLTYYHKELWSSHKEWRDAQKQVLDLQKTGDEEGAVKYYQEQSKVLQGKGIKPIMLPPSLSHLLPKEAENKTKE